MIEKAFFSGLAGNDINLLNKIRKGIQDYRPAIQISRFVSTQRLQEISKILLENDPCQIAIKGFRFFAYPMAIQLQPIYVYSEQEGKPLLAECQRQREIILSKSKAVETYTAVQEIHDILSRNIKYVAGEEPELHSIVGPLTKKKGVCEGYAKTMKFLMDKMSIPCLVITGTAYNQALQQEESHAWNLIQINGEWCHVDVTFDTTIRDGDVLRYDYFGLSTEQIMQDHRYNVSAYPTAISKRLSYYEKNGLIMNTKAALGNFILHEINLGHQDMVFKLPLSAPENGIEKKVSSVISNILFQNHNQEGFTLSYNIKQRVFHVHID